MGPVFPAKHITDLLDLTINKLNNNDSPRKSFAALCIFTNLDKPL